MLTMKTLSVAVAADGTFTGYVDNWIPGRLVAIKFAFGDLANTLDLTITGDKTGMPLFTYTNVPAANAWWFPVKKATVVDADPPVASTVTDVPVFVMQERIKVVAAGGGASKTGTLTFFIDEGA